MDFGVPSCIAIEMEFEIDAYGDKEIVLSFGEEEEKEKIAEIAKKYSDVKTVKEELKLEKDYWNNILRKVQVKTKDDEIDFMLNGFAMYQTIVCRLFSRSAYYQSGGAFGFRDQLQDTLSKKFISPEILKKQILKHAEHQFEDGDVEHWWHDETSRGIRTRFSDDYLWLVYSVCEYIEFTGDKSILDEECRYTIGNKLESFEDEKYDIHWKTEYKESIYKHLIKAIERALDFGENGLPKIGSGDWNDGFSKVRKQGKRRKHLASDFSFMIF